MNRQKFLAELAKLLSFMYEEDRRYALDMYERMFNIAGEDEQWLIQNLMSPTRQAVIIARAYDAKERSLTVSAHWKEDDGYEDESDETPPFVLAINKIFDDLFPEEEEAEEEAEEQDLDPGSLSPEKEDEPKEQKKNKMPRAAVLLSSTQEFDTITKQIEEAVLSELSEKEDQEDDWDDEYEAGFDETDEETDAVREPDPRVNVIDRAEAFDLSEENPAQETADEPEEEKQAEHAAGSDTEAAAPILEPETEKNKAEDIISNPEIPEENADGRRSPKSVPLFEEEDREPVKQMEEPTPEEQPAAAEQATEELSVASEQPEPVRREAVIRELPEEDTPVIPKPEPMEKNTERIAKERVLNIPILVLFLIPAVPITLAVLVLLALLAALCLGLSVSLIALGAVLIISAFSGFAVLADIMLLLGAALISLAVALLLFWTVFWLVGEVMVDTVNQVRELAEKWCYKEVPAA